MDRRETDLPIRPLLALDINGDRENSIGSNFGDVKRNSQGYTLVSDVFNADCDRIPVAMNGTQRFDAQRIWGVR